MIHLWFVGALLAAPAVMPVGEVQPGQKGECLTVFENQAVEPVPFVVRGVMQDFIGPGRPLVLVRLLGEKAEFTGVVAGMSGSPCSVNGKLVGALSYAFATFAKEPIAGITPIADMLEVLDLPREERPWRLSQSAASSTDDWKSFRSGSFTPSPPAEGPQPVESPLVMTGLTPDIRARFDPWLRQVGFLPMAGGSVGSNAQAQPLVPGSAVAAVLVRGDINIAATGTVTFVDKGRVLAFGHPFFGAGTISMPMANAQIVNTMASAMRSFKMANVGATVGEISQDRLTAISGTMGKAPSMLPVVGNLASPAGKAPFHFDVARDVQLTPRLLAIALAGALAGRVEASERGTVRLSARLSVEGLQPISITNVYSAERNGNLLVDAAVDVAQALAALWDSPFGPPPRMGVSVDVALSSEPVEEWVQSIHLDRAEAHPGDTLNVAVELRRKDGPTVFEQFKVAVPRSWADAEVTLMAAGAEGAEQLEREIGGTPQPTRLADIGRWLATRRSDGNLYLLAVEKSVGMRVGVELVASAPPSMVAIMSGTPAHQARARSLTWEERHARPGVVSGLTSSVLHVLPY